MISRISDLVRDSQSQEGAEVTDLRDRDGLEPLTVVVCALHEGDELAVDGGAVGEDVGQRQQQPLLPQLFRRAKDRRCEETVRPRFPQQSGGKRELTGFYQR